MNSGPIEDRLAIRELVESFAAGAMRIDAEKWGKNWAENASWKLVSMPEPVVGKANIIEYFVKVMAYVDYMSMISFPDELTINGDTAEGKCYCRELIFTKSGDEKIVVGCYHDHYVKQQGRWLFQSRRYEILGVKT